jgi:hypothetical protein
MSADGCADAQQCTSVVKLGLGCGVEDVQRVAMQLAKGCMH